jgi:hypothetical protein
MWPHLDRLGQAVNQGKFHYPLTPSERKSSRISNILALYSPASWVTRGKFPPEVKPILASVALEAIKHGDYGDKFFQLMPALFPYNKFTMTVSALRPSSSSCTKFIISFL